jgi:hypothetical protein
VAPTANLEVKNELDTEERKEMRDAVYRHIPLFYYLLPSPQLKKSIAQGSNVSNDLVIIKELTFKNPVNLLTSQSSRDDNMTLPGSQERAMMKKYKGSWFFCLFACLFACFVALRSEPRAYCMLSTISTS